MILFHHLDTTPISDGFIFSTLREKQWKKSQPKAFAYSGNSNQQAEVIKSGKKTNCN